MQVNWAITCFVVLFPGWLAWYFGHRWLGTWGRRAGCLIWWLCLAIACSVGTIGIAKVMVIVGVDRIAVGSPPQGSAGGSSTVPLGSAGPVKLNSMGVVRGGSGGTEGIPYWDVYKNACTGEHPDCPLILAAVASVESGFDPNAISSAGAGGLFQIMPLHGLGDGVFEPSMAAPYAWKLLVDWGVREDPAMASCRYLRGATGCLSTGGLGNAVTLDYVRDIYGPRSPHLRSRLGVGDSSGGIISQGWHGLAGFKAFDIVAPGLCGQELLAPITGVVTYNGDDGLGVGTTMLTIKGLSGAEKVTLLHGDYNVRVGDPVIAGWSSVGVEASRGNSTGCHSHYIYYNTSGVNTAPTFLGENR